jgi:FAD/FMN-containing dehydrogenase
MSYAQKKQKLIAEFLELQAAAGEAVALKKTTSNLFRDRTRVKAKRLDVRGFNQVIRVDPQALTVDVEGMTTFEDLVDATLKHGLVPLVVPELKTITIGGGVSGLAVESSSFQYGQVHESVLAMDVLLASGQVVTCRPDNEHRDLFYGLPNSYGTLGYILKVTTKLRRIKPYVHLRHLRFDNTKAYFKELDSIATSRLYEGQPLQFIDGVIFDPQECYITLGFDSDEAPYTSDYTSMHIYYRSIRQRDEDYLSAHDYIWRWDTDWFWCSRMVKADNPIVRRLLGRRHLNSRTYGKLLRLDRQYHIARRLQLGRLNGITEPGESIIQDIEVPSSKAGTFYDFFRKTIGISPVWVCPTKSATGDWLYPLYPMNPQSLYINFGFWDSLPTTRDPDEGYYNQLIEDRVEKLGGMKSLYSNSYYARPRFEKLYNYPTYRKLKKRYDPQARFKDLYDKCVQKNA